MVLFVIHRIAADAWSTVVLLDDLRILYTDPPKAPRNNPSLSPSPTFGMSSSFSSGGAAFFNSGSGAPALPRLRAQFVEYRDWLERTLDSSAEGERLWEYWLRKLGGDLPVLDLPTDFPRKAGDASVGGLSSQNGVAHRFSIEADVMASLIEFAREAGLPPNLLNWGRVDRNPVRRRRAMLTPTVQPGCVAGVHGVTMIAILLAAWATLLHRYSNQDELLISTPMACRK